MIMSLTLQVTVSTASLISSNTSPVCPGEEIVLTWFFEDNEVTWMDNSSLGHHTLLVKRDGPASDIHYIYKYYDLHIKITTFSIIFTLTKCYAILDLDGATFGCIDASGFNHFYTVNITG